MSSMAGIFFVLAITVQSYSFFHFILFISTTIASLVTLTYYVNKVEKIKLDSDVNEFFNK